MLKLCVLQSQLIQFIYSFIFILAVEEARSLLNSSRLTADSVSFPDTIVNLNTVGRTRNLSSVNEEETYTIIGDEITITKNNRASGKGKEDTSSKKVETAVQAGQQDVNNQQPSSKRGQKGKIKKIKEKYKDQDDDEKKLRMELLQVNTFLKFLYSI